MFVHCKPWNYNPIIDKIPNIAQAQQMDWQSAILCPVKSTQQRHLSDNTGAVFGCAISGSSFNNQLKLLMLVSAALID